MQMQTRLCLERMTRKVSDSLDLRGQERRKATSSKTHASRADLSERQNSVRLITTCSFCAAASEAEIQG